MNGSIKQRARLECEALESRLTPAGNVTAKVLPTGLLQIKGDDQPNEVQITRGASDKEVKVSVYPQAGPTTLNKQSGPQFFKVTAGIEVLMGGGKDDLLIQGTFGKALSITGSLTVDMGADNDYLRAEYLNVSGPCRLYAGKGVYTDRIEVYDSIFANYLHVSVGNGNSNADVQRCRVTKMLKVDASGTGTNHFILEDVTSLQDEIWAVMAGGDDTLEADGLSSKLPTTLDGGTGYDTLHKGVVKASKLNLNSWESQPAI